MVDESFTNGAPVAFRAETRQLLEILIHSLYTEREVFLRELISNASDAITRLSYEMLTNRDVLDADTELGIWITADPNENTLTIRDTGIGMNAEELAQNLGTIAHSGARAFIEAAKDANARLSDMIGQFGVGFYSAFMIAEWIQVTSRSYRLDDKAASWYSTGADTFQIDAAEKNTRGTEIRIKLKSDAGEFAQENRLREIIKRHSDYIPYPIYLGEKMEQANEQTALWRQQPREVDAEKYDQFYRQFTLELEPAITRLHLAVDAPYQMYALLYVPAQPEKGFFALRKQDGLKLYARKVLIQEYTTTLLPEYFRFMHGVVDSEDIPLNVSRESIQSNRVMQALKKILTGKLIDTLKNLGQEKPEDYARFWKGFGHFIKEGIATDRDNAEALYPLLRYKSIKHDSDWVSLSDYVQGMNPEQKKIYYLVGDDERTAVVSPHLEVFRKNGLDVLLMTDPLDPFVLSQLTKYNDFELANVALEKPETQGDTTSADHQSAENTNPEQVSRIIEQFKSVLGERVVDVRTTDRLVESPARLVDPDNTPNPEMQRIYRILNKETETPKKVLEINTGHPIIQRLMDLEPEDLRINDTIAQILDNALLVEGLHPDPVGMIQRIQKLIERSLD